MINILLVVLSLFIGILNPARIPPPGFAPVGTHTNIANGTYSDPNTGVQHLAQSGAVGGYYFDEAQDAWGYFIQPDVPFVIEVYQEALR